jgi:glucose/arabinose dehydrogenase
MPTSCGRALTGAMVLLVIAASPALAQTGETLTGAAAFGGWQDDAPGVRRQFKLDDLPAAAGRPAQARAAVEGRDEAMMPKVPPGFAVSLVDKGLNGPRVIRTAPNGDIFVAESKAGRVLAYRLDAKGAIVAKNVFAADLQRPYGIAFYPPGPEPRFVYVANAGSVVRFPYKPGALEAAGPAETIIDKIPSEHHWTRDIAFTPDGRTLYLSVGSGSNVAEGIGRDPPDGLEDWEKAKPLGAAWGAEAGRAVLLAYTPEGKDGRTVATGLRNCAGVTLDPVDAAPWCVVNERDMLGDDVPFEYATKVRDGGFYGWPWYLSGGQEDPRYKGARPDLAGKVTAPDVLIQPHSAPLGIAFYEGSAFPPAYKGDAFVTLHGSWNRSDRTGYKVVRLIFDKGRPTGAYEDFMTGFVLSKNGVWGRPVGVAVAKDGALLVSEDGSGTIWRVTHQGG